MERHLHALWHDVGQVNVSTVDVISSPRIFLELISQRQVSRSFASNFFLARLISEIQALESAQYTERSNWDFSNMVFLVSGGEANDVRTCVELSGLLEKK